MAFAKHRSCEHIASVRGAAELSYASANLRTLHRKKNKKNEAQIGRPCRKLSRARGYSARSYRGMLPSYGVSAEAADSDAPKEDTDDKDGRTTGAPGCPAGAGGSSGGGAIAAAVKSSPRRPLNKESGLII